MTAAGTPNGQTNETARAGAQPDSVCPGCGGSDGLAVLTAGEEQALLRCRACALVYTWPPLAAGARDVYPADYYAHRRVVWRPGPLAALRGVVLHRYYGYPLPGAMRWPRGLVRLLGAVLAPVRGAWRTIPPYTASGRLLDVGCGSGAYLARVHALGWTVCGVEPDAGACAIAREVFPADVHCGTLDDAPWPPQSFDVITLWHSLEHVAQPLPVLRAAHALLKHGGLLMLEAPNWNSAQRRVFGRRWFHLDLPRHRLHFTARTLERYLDEAEFVNIRMGTVASTVGVSGSLETLLGVGQQQGDGRAWRHNRVLKALLWPLDALCSLFGAGGCLAATARKP